MFIAGPDMYMTEVKLDVDAPLKVLYEARISWHEFIAPSPVLPFGL